MCTVVARKYLTPRSPAKCGFTGGLRLRTLGATRWEDLAVLSRTRRDLAVVRAVAEQENIPISWPLERGKIPPLHRIREIGRLLSSLANRRTNSARASELMNEMGLSSDVPPINPWTALAKNVLENWSEETDDQPAPISALIEYFYESLGQRRRDEHFGRGVILNTVHAAKGTEYAHVLLGGDWSGIKPSEIEEQRRVFYVGMTRARHTLTLFNRMDRRNPLAGELSGPCFAPRRENMSAGPVDLSGHDYQLLGLEDLFLDFAGRHEADHPIHASLAALKPGDCLSLRPGNSRPELIDARGGVVAQLSAQAGEKWGENLSRIQQVRVICLVARQRSDNPNNEYQNRLRADAWEVPICELTVGADPSAAKPPK